VAKIKGKIPRFSHICLEDWRNFAKVDVDLQRRVFLIGANASGKSNFLDVFRFLRDIVAVGGGFQKAVDKRGGVSSLRCLSARRYSNIVVQIRIGTNDNESAWEYQLHFNQDRLRRPIIRQEKVFRGGSEILIRPDKMDRDDPERLRQTHLEQVYVNQAFREVADFFISVHYMHIVPQLVREPDRSVGKTNDPFGGDFLEQVAQTQEKTRNSRLRRIQEALKIAVPQLKELELFRHPVRSTWHLRGKYEHWRARGAWQTEDQFSDGTLRLMGLLWAALDGSGPLLLEEPELSLHPEVVRFIPQMFARIQRHSGRQIILSTHSSDLLEDSGIGIDEVLLLLPEAEGTSVRPTSEFEEIKQLLESGLSFADVVIPQTRPEKVEQLPLFEK
jgi:predicted ATPase